MFARSERIALATGLAESHALLLNELHEYYSNEIIPRAVTAGIPLSHEFRSNGGTLPFPATFINDFGVLLNQRVAGMSAALYSDYPFAWAEGRTLSPLQQEALAFLRDHPDRPFVRLVKDDGGEIIHLARALMMTQSCVDCHNAFDAKRPRPWKVGDFRGVREVSLPLVAGPSSDGRAYALAGVLSMLAALVGALAVWPAVARLNRALKRSEHLSRELEHMASHDPLTGLPSLRLGRDRLEQAVAQARRGGGKAALMFVDLDGFKAVNDTHGHEAGDRVLAEAAVRMLDCVRESDTVARVGGDEFIVILTNTADPSRAEVVAGRIVQALSIPFTVGSDQAAAAIGCSIGIALYPDDGEDAESLLRLSDTCMYEVKRSGKNSYRRVSRSQDAGAAECSLQSAEL